MAIEPDLRRGPVWKLLDRRYGNRNESQDRPEAISGDGPGSEAKHYLRGEIALHVHAGFWGSLPAVESDGDEFCAVFEVDRFGMVGINETPLSDPVALSAVAP